MRRTETIPPGSSLGIPRARASFHVLAGLPKARHGIPIGFDEHTFHSWAGDGEEREGRALAARQGVAVIIVVVLLCSRKAMGIVGTKPNDVF